MKVNLWKCVVMTWVMAPLLGVAQYATLITTFTNPSPTFVGNGFGLSVNVAGVDRVLIGAPYARGTNINYRPGEAYLFSTNGTLLTTFRSPNPISDQDFGLSLCAVGPDRVLVGAPFSSAAANSEGIAYLFSTNGSLLNTITNPTGLRNLFACSVAAVDTDRLLIGSAFGTNQAGAAYLFSTNGNLITTFGNPTPAIDDGFGLSVATLGTEHVLIGAHGDDSGGPSRGAAYLFAANGTLLTSFTNLPPISRSFGLSVIAAGTDKLLIGGESAVAYVHTNGTLLGLYTNQVWPFIYRYGLQPIAAVAGSVLNGSALNDLGNANAVGAVNLFSIEGSLRLTITNPAPADNDRFGCSLAAVGNDCILVGAYMDNATLNDSGAAYLFQLPPFLRIALTSTNSVAISWPAFASGFVLQQNTNGIGSSNWSNVADSVQTDGTNNSLIIQPPSLGNRFYRLSR